MIFKPAGWRSLFFFLCLLISVSSIAQPLLPDIAGKVEKGVVILSWNCQYNGVKSIAVLRSADSTFNYATVGYVKKLDKGIQAYIDGHPTPGSSYYKLAVVFNSGLTWSTNHCNIHVDSAALSATNVVLPANDALQKYITTEETTEKPTAAVTPATQPKPAVKPTLVSTTQKETIKTANSTGNDKKTSTSKPVPAKEEISVSFDADSAKAPAAAAVADTPIPEPPRKKITISFNADPDVNAATFIKSRYIFTDPLNGYVNMDLPDDVKTHRYSVKFYDELNHVVIEVPRINAPKIIMDKRNFQKTGLYKFILRKDVTELESGYITIY